MKKKQVILFMISILTIVLIVSWVLVAQNTEDKKALIKSQQTEQGIVVDVTPTSSLRKLEDGMSVIQYDEDYGFQGFLDQGGASTDDDVIQYLMEHVISNVSGFGFLQGLFGCSTIQTRNEQQEVLFGRNFDWQKSESLIVMSKPSDAYASISTVNLDFIQRGAMISIDQLPDDILASVAMYAPLDGMNEKGFVISVNMIQDPAIIQQSGKQQDLTTTTAIRLLLNQAANVDEAIALLREYNMHSSMNMMIHFAMTDITGKSVVVEYVNNEMNVIETPVVTNFYLSDGEKQGIGTNQSHQRYDLLMDLLDTNKTMNMDQLRDALDRVSKDNFDEFESTEWSIAYNLNQKEIHYYHRENYNQRYVFHLAD